LLPSGKIDDFIIQADMSKRDLRWLLNNAIPARSIITMLTSAQQHAILEVQSRGCTTVKASANSWDFPHVLSAFTALAWGFPFDNKGIKDELKLGLFHKPRTAGSRAGRLQVIYVDMTGDLIAGLMLSQIIYWNLPAKDGTSRLRARHDGQLWLAKSREDWWGRVPYFAKTGRSSNRHSGKQRLCRAKDIQV
jgi:hypothetical protein